MSVLWLLKGIPDFENISPLVIRALKGKDRPQLLIAFDSASSAENPSLIEALNQFTAVLNFEPVDLVGLSAQELDFFLNSKSIKTIIFDWGNGYPTKFSHHLKWLFSKKKTSFRSRLIKAGKKNKIRLVCLPHAVSMHESVSIKPKKLTRTIFNFFTRSNTVEDYSDRNIFDALLFYNETQCLNYKKFFNLKNANTGLAYLYKYDDYSSGSVQRRQNKEVRSIVLSVPKLRNFIDVDLLVQTLKFLEEYCQHNSVTVICAFHPRVDTKSLPSVLLDALDAKVFETCTQPFSHIVNRTRILLDAGSSIILDGLAHGLPVVYLEYLDGNRIVAIDDPNYYEVAAVEQLESVLDAADSGKDFVLPDAFVRGTRYTAEQLLLSDNGWS